MKILHITAFHISLTTGGTELYIEGLKSAFEKNFHARNYIAVFSPVTPVSPLTEDVEFHHPENSSPAALKKFRIECKEMLERIQPDFAIFHTSDNYEGLLAEEMVLRHIPYLFILHAPYWLCYQKDRLFCCKTPCNKLFAPFRCSICSWQGNSFLPLNILKSLVGELLRQLHLVPTSRYYEIKKEILPKEYLIRNASGCIMLNQRDYDCFRLNGFPEEKLHRLNTALSEDTLAICKRNAQISREGCLKILCAGRLASVKGCHILVQAAHSLDKKFHFQLDFFGVGSFEDDYVKQNIMLAEQDPRIHFYPMQPHEEILKKYAEYDIQCLPSTVFDNGPLALWEGAYSGCLVATSENVGQKSFIAEFGRIISPNTVEAWRSFLEYAVSQTQKIRADKRIIFPSYNSMNLISEKILEWMSQKQENLFL